MIVAVLTTSDPDQHSYVFATEYEAERFAEACCPEYAYNISNQEVITGALLEQMIAEAEEEEEDS